MIPGYLTGNNPLARWLNKLRDAVAEATITSVLGGRLQRGAGGTQLIIEPGKGGGGTPGEYRIKSVQGDYLTCRSWDGTNEGSTDIYIAKAYRLREALTSEGGYTYTYEAGFDSLNRKRKKYPTGTPDDYEYEVVIPRWIADEVINCVYSSTSVEVSGAKLNLILVDNRAWAAIYE